MPKPDDHLPSLDTLQQRIDEAKSQQGKGIKDDKPEPPGAFGKAMNLAGGLVSGAALGAISGYYLDRWLDVSPLFLITCFFLGFAGGLYNLVRAAGKEG